MYPLLNVLKKKVCANKMRMTYEYIGVSLVPPSLNHITICILSVVTEGVILQGNLAMPPCTASTVYTSVAEKKKKTSIKL